MKPRMRYVLSGLITISIAASLAACSASSSPSGTERGGTVTWAETAGASPNYIFPMDALLYTNPQNVNQFQSLMWRPLYWFGAGNKVVLNEQLSLAQPPVYSDNNSVVTINLKRYQWSDGKLVTSRDVLFWMNLLKANRTDGWGNYVPGYFPDNVKTMTAPSSTQVVFHLTGPVDPSWFTFSELSQIWPLPQHVWDKTSMSSPVGNYDQTSSGAVAVYNFLSSESKKTTTYTANPLWKVVDGPWRLSQFSVGGRIVFVPNKSYSGAVKPRISQFIEVPFTSATAEFNALRAGQLTYGYIPQPDLSQKSVITGSGYNVSSWDLWSMNILPINFNNPSVGAIFRQTYVRQAMESLIDQPLIVSSILHGTGIPDYGPVPTYPRTPYLTPLTSGNGPFPYSVARARQLLQQHGWNVRPNSVSVCAHPGTGPGQCGAGVHAGAQLSFNLRYAAGLPEVDQEMQALKSSFSEAGIVLNLSQAPLDDVLSSTSPCEATSSACTWQMSYWAIGWMFSPDYYPSGEIAFATNSIGDYSSYSNGTMDQLIRETTTQPSLTVFHQWVDYTARQVPMLFMPIAPNQISAIQDSLHGAIPQSVTGTLITPEDWYFTK